MCGETDQEEWNAMPDHGQSFEGKRHHPNIQSEQTISLEAEGCLIWLIYACKYEVMNALFVLPLQGGTGFAGAGVDLKASKAGAAMMA